MTAFSMPARAASQNGESVLLSNTIRLVAVELALPTVAVPLFFSGWQPAKVSVARIMQSKANGFRDMGIPQIIQRGLNSDFQVGRNAFSAPNEFVTDLY